MLVGGVGVEYALAQSGLLIEFGEDAVPEADPKPLFAVFQKGSDAVSGKAQGFRSVVFEAGCDTIGSIDSIEPAFFCTHPDAAIGGLDDRQDRIVAYGAIGGPLAIDRPEFSVEIDPIDTSIVVENPEFPGSRILDDTGNCVRR